LRDVRSIDDWLRDIVRWGEKVARPIDGMDEQAFLSDEKTQDAAAKCAESIGSAAKEVLAIDPEFDRKHPGARLVNAYSSRNRLSHGYFSIDPGILWVTVSRSVPATVKAVKFALGRRNSNDNDGGDGAGGGPSGGP
jgi:uncharacterized protein with HEPN domain